MSGSNNLLEGCHSISLDVGTNQCTITKVTKTVEGETVVETTETKPWWETTGPVEAYPGDKPITPAKKEESDFLKDLRRQRDQDMSVLDMKIEEMHKKFRARVEEREREAEVEKERLYKIPSDRVMKWVKSQESFISSDLSTSHSSVSSPATPTLTATDSSCLSTPESAFGRLRL